MQPIEGICTCLQLWVELNQRAKQQNMKKGKHSFTGVSAPEQHEIIVRPAGCKISYTWGWPNLICIV